MAHKANVKAVDSMGRSALKHAQLAHHSEAAARLAVATRKMDGIDEEEEHEEPEEVERVGFLTQSLGIQSHF